MLRLLRKPEPLTDAAESEAPSLAKPEAYRVLLSEIKRYCKQETGGRSFLISGSRGAGKTTLVRLAIDTARRDPLMARAMLVNLHGPHLLSGIEKPAVRPEDPKKKKQEEAGGGKVEAPPKTSEPAVPPEPELTPQQSLAQSALVVITKALYRAYSDELIRAYARAVRKKVSVTGPAQLPRQEQELLLEMAASLPTAFDRAPSLSMLRQYWERAGFLETGVLGRQGPRGSGLSQGMRELVAAGSARDAFRLVVGTLSLNENTQQSSSLAQTSNSGFDYKQVMNPLLGLLTGGIVGGTLAASGSAPVVSALSAVGTAVVAAATLNYTVTHTNNRTDTGNEGFVWDTGIGSLDRMLPSILERILDAGLAPIFVVDELDKVGPSLEKDMEKLISHLKQVVTERAFFCFLTNRDYFEYVELARSKANYGPEHTFFTHPLFLSFEASELREYVLSNIAPSTDPEEITDRAVLPYVLTQWAKVNPIDLQRGLSMVTDSDGSLTLPPGMVRQPGYSHAAFYQLVVEYILQTQEVRGRIRQDPDYRRLVYDALYYVARRWNNESEKLDLRLGTFASYLENQSQKKINYPDEPGALSKDRRVTDLHGIMLQLVGYLSEPVTFRTLLEAEATKPKAEAFTVDPPSVLDTVPTSKDRPLLRLTPDGQHADWVYNGFGGLLERPEMHTEKQASISGVGRIVHPESPASPVLPGLAAKMSEIEEISKLATDLRVGLGRMATEYSLLETVPAWPQVAAAIESEKQHKANSTDLETIDKFHEMLVRNGEVWRAGLVLAASLRTQQPSWEACLSIVSRQLALAWRPVSQREIKLRELLGQLDNYLGGQKEEVSAFVSNRSGIGGTAVLERLKRLVGPPDAVTRRWRTLPVELRRGTGQKDWIFEADLDILFAEAHEPTTFQAHTASMSMSDWAALIRQTSEKKLYSASISILFHLGFFSQVLSQAPGHPELSDLVGASPSSGYVTPKVGSLLLLEEAVLAGRPTQQWQVYPAVADATLPIFRKDLTRMEAEIFSIGISRVFIEKSPATSESELEKSLRSPPSFLRELPVFLLVSERPLRPTLEIQAVSLPEAVEKATALSAYGLVNWMKLLPAPTS